MRELSTDEIPEVAGGGLVSLAVTLGVGLAANYVYEAIGGREGIDNFFREFSEANRIARQYELMGCLR